MLPKNYVRHLEKDWRVVDARELTEDGESVLNVSLALGADSVIHDKINVSREPQRLAEFDHAVGDYGSYDELLDRRVGVVRDRFGAVRGYTPSFFPLSCGRQFGL